MTDSDLRDAFASNKDILFRFAYRMTGSVTAAEDVVQECFLNLLRRPGAYDPNRGAVRAFLLGVARNLVLMQWRKERPYEALEDESSVCMPLDLVNSERWEAVARAVQLLPPLQREAVILAEYEDMSLEEIAMATQAEIAAVKSRLHRARENLRRLLSPLMEGKGAVNGTERR
jgi:RNA polymerase sigma-70 factor (ECF subfamily)